MLSTVPGPPAPQRQHRSTAASALATAPVVAFYEVTRACALVCQHCRACAQPKRDPLELTGEQSLALIAELARFEPAPIVVLTGGDPLERPDVFDLVRAGTARGLRMAMTPSATPKLTDAALAELGAAGLSRLALSLDGAQAKTHDAFRGVPGSHARTWRALDAARELGLTLQVNTTVTTSTVRELDALAHQLAGAGISLWSLFFLVPTGRAQREQCLDAVAMEDCFARLAQIADRAPFAVKTTEAPHYRRFLAQRAGSLPSRARPEGMKVRPGTAADRKIPAGIGDGKGVLFIDHRGTIHPSGFLPLTCGQFPRDSIVDVYQTHTLFLNLRNPDALAGKCGRCEFRNVCGGSRARAHAASGDPLGEDPDCAYQPPLRATPPKGALRATGS